MDSWLWTPGCGLRAEDWLRAPECGLLAEGSFLAVDSRLWTPGCGVLEGLWEGCVEGLWESLLAAPAARDAPRLSGGLYLHNVAPLRYRLQKLLFVVHFGEFV